jgi:hypothetical protein
MEQEITLQEIISKFVEYVKEVSRNWKKVLLLTIVFSAYWGYNAYKTPITYIAELTFMVNEDEGGFGGAGAASSILGSLGLGAGQEYNLDKILELSKSSRIINESLLNYGEVDGNKDLFINHFIRVYNLSDGEWSKDKCLGNSFRFSQVEFDKLNSCELKALKIIYKKIIGDNKGAIGLLKAVSNRNSSIMEMQLTTKSEDLSIKFLNEIYLNLGNFYVKKSIEKQKFTYEVIINKADSLKRLLSNKESSKAKFDDSNRGLISEYSRVPSQRLVRDVSMLNIMYAEAIKNAEVADFAIKSKVPFIQSIDIPFAPLTPNKASLISSLIIGSIIGFIIGTLLVVINKVVEKALSKNK